MLPIIAGFGATISVITLFFSCFGYDWFGDSLVMNRNLFLGSKLSSVLALK